MRISTLLYYCYINLGGKDATSNDENLKQIAESLNVKKLKSEKKDLNSLITVIPDVHSVVPKNDKFTDESYRSFISKFIDYLTKDERYASVSDFKKSKKAVPDSNSSAYTPKGNTKKIRSGNNVRSHIKNHV